MLRLIERGLMYGNLVEVTSPTQVARYNAALEKLTGRRTGLESFHIDLSGFSPEIGHEFGDDSYLNPHGCNRQFILLTLAQEACPLIGARFSSSRSILQQFIEDNRQALFALTARDAVIGELLNSVYRIDSPTDLLSIRTIRVEVDTARAMITDAAELRKRIDRFMESDSDWWDERALEEMVAFAGRVGDITRHPLMPEKTVYRKGNFYTSHLGGLYVFRDTAQPALIHCDPGFEFPGSDIPLIPMGDSRALAAFLEANGLVETVFDAQGLDERALLQQRLDFIVIDHLASQDGSGDLERLTRQDLRAALYRHIDNLPEEFHRIAATLRGIDQGVQRGALDPGQPAYFYHLRSAIHIDRDLVNHLLAQLTPLDVRQLFICNKDLFYRTYRSWSEPKRAYVAEFLAREYAIDKQGVRETLFGPEPAMDAVPQPPEMTRDGERTEPSDDGVSITRARKAGSGSVPRSGRLPDEPDKPVAVPKTSHRPKSDGKRKKKRRDARSGPWGPRSGRPRRREDRD